MMTRAGLSIHDGPVHFDVLHLKQRGRHDDSSATCSEILLGS